MYGYGYSKSFFSVFFCLILFGLFSATGIQYIDHIKAQSTQIFRINVEVTNNANGDKYGTVYININDSPAVDGLRGQLFPAGETVSFEFMFSTKKVPIGKGFVAEVVYGNDDVHKRAYSENTSANSSETISINISY